MSHKATLEVGNKIITAELKGDLKTIAKDILPTIVNNIRRIPKPVLKEFFPNLAKYLNQMELKFGNKVKYYRGFIELPQGHKGLIVFVKNLKSYLNYPVIIDLETGEVFGDNDVIEKYKPIVSDLINLINAVETYGLSMIGLKTKEGAVITEETLKELLPEVMASMQKTESIENPNEIGLEFDYLVDIDDNLQMAMY